MPSIGDRITVNVSGRLLTGSVKFATAAFLSVDQGGCTLLLRRNENLNAWMLGGRPVTVTVTGTFSKRMQAVHDAACKKFEGGLN